MQLVHSCLRAKLGIVPFFSTFSPVPKRYPKRYLSDTLLVHKSSQIHPVPSNQKERKSRPKRRQKTGIESPNGHEHRQLQFNLIYISDLFITISYVHAPNTVKRYSELRKTIPMSHRAPQLYWVLPAAHIYIYIDMMFFLCFTYVVLYLDMIWYLNRSPYITVQWRGNASINTSSWSLKNHGTGGVLIVPVSNMVTWKSAWFDSRFSF